MVLPALSSGDRTLRFRGLRERPSLGRCTAAQVAPDGSPYSWLEDPDGIGEFRHAIRVLPESVVEVDRNDDRVHPALRARLKLRGRHWQVYAEDEFRQL